MNQEAHDAQEALVPCAALVVGPAVHEAMERRRH